MVTIVCAATLLLKTIYASQLHDAEQLRTLWNAKALLSNFLLLFRGWPKLSVLGYNNPTWYICILIQCYIAFFGIQWISEKLPVKPIVFYGAFIVFSIGLYGLHVLPNDNLRGYECFFMGTMLEEILTWLDNRAVSGKKNTRICILGVSAYILALLAAVVCIRFDIALSQRMVVVFVVYPPLIVAAWYLRNRFTSNAVRVLGKISFEAYLWHYPLMVLWKILITATYWEVTHSYLTLVAFTAIVYIFAFVMYYRLEQPISKRLRKWENRNDTGRSATAQA